MDSPRSKLQKTILILLPIMAVVFGVVTGVLRSRPGVSYRGALLYWTQEGDAEVYAGEVHGEAVSIIRRPDGRSVEVDVTVADSLVHQCRVDFPEGTIDVDGSAYPRVEITRDGELLFRGAYNPYAGFQMLFNEDGAWHIDVTVYAGDEPREPDFDEFAIFRFAQGPELVRRGSWAVWALAALLLSGVAALDAAFPLALFRLQYFLSVRDPEPTDFYLSMQKVSWVVITALIFGVYVWSLTIIE